VLYFVYREGVSGFVNNTIQPKHKDIVWSIPFIMIFAVNICNAIGFHILTPILPKYAVSLNLGNSVAGMLGTMFAITSIISRITLTQINLSGRYRKAIILALGLISISMFGYSISNTAEMLYLFRLVQGMGWGVCTAALATLAALTLPPSQIGAGIGMFGLGSVFGQALAPNLGLTLVDMVGYHNTFLISFGVLVVAIILCFCLKNIETVSDAGQKRYGGRIAFKDMNWSPLFPTLVIMISMIPASAVTSFIALTAESRGVVNIGLFFTVNAFSLLFIRPFFGKLSDHIHPWTLLIPSLMVYALVMIGLHFANSLLVFLILAFFNAFSFGSINPTTQAWSVRMVEKAQIGMAQIIFYTGLDLGSGIGSFIAGAIADKAGYSDIYLWMLIPIVILLITLIVYGFMKRGHLLIIKREA
jgi:predicted MFS family arabinose efflux permease